MARPRNIVPQYISLDMQKLDIIQTGISSDAEFGKWMRKAIRDFRSGCCANDVDPFVKEQYDVAYSRMVKRQTIDAENYQAAKETHTHASRKGRNTAAAGADHGNTSEDSHTSGNPSSSAPESPTPATATLFKRAYGENKKVLLTIEEGEKLRLAYKENLELALDILDGYLVNNPKRKYKSHYAVLRKSGWVWNEVQRKLKDSAQLEKAKNNPKSFQQVERERGSILALNVMRSTEAI